MVQGQDCGALDHEHDSFLCLSHHRDKRRRHRSFRAQQYGARYHTGAADGLRISHIAAGQKKQPPDEYHRGDGIRRRRTCFIHRRHHRLSVRPFQRDDRSWGGAHGFCRLVRPQVARAAGIGCSRTRSPSNAEEIKYPTAEAAGKNTF